MAFRFCNYTVDELEKCAIEFANYFVGMEDCITPEWTRRVLNWFELACAENLRVYPTSGSRLDEFLVDLCHTTYPPTSIDAPDGWVEWWHNALSMPCRVRLALESEWGSANSSGLNLRRVLDDARKLAAIRADVKVMIFASRNLDNHNQIVESLSRLRVQSGDSAPWLWLDLPWTQDTEAGGCAVTKGVLK